MAAALPEEVLRKIFFIAYDDYRSAFQDELSAFHIDPIEDVRSTTPHEELIGTLSAVCRSWRKVAESTSIMWTEVTCPLGDSDAADAIAIRRLDRAVTFSEEHVLSVRLTLDTSYARYGDTGISLSMQSLMPHLHRIHSFIAVVKSASTAKPPAEGQTVRGPSLSTAPKLSDSFRALWHTNPIYLLPRVLSSDEIPFSRLRTLVLRDVLFTRLSHLVFLLQHCIELQDLTLHGLADDMIIDKQPNMHFALPKLMSCDIDCSHLSIMSRIGLSVPKLGFLQVRNVNSKLQPECDHQGACNHENDINWCFAKAVRVLAFHRYSDMAVMHLMHDLPEIDRLTFIQCQAGLVFTRLLCRRMPAILFPTGFAVPKLEELTLFGGEIDDEDVRLLLEERDSTKNPEVRTLMLRLNSCHKLTKKSVDALARLGRGTCNLVQM